MRFRGSPLGAVIAGALAGAVGTLAMDAVLYARYRRGGGGSPPVDWEFKGVDSWDKASVPGQLGKRLYEGYLQKPLPDSRAQITNTVMHWGYGAGWGALYGVVAGSLRKPGTALGPPFGALVWLTGYLIIPPTGLYKPIWEYDAGTLWKDFSAHLAYGAGVASAFRLLGSASAK